MTKEASGFIAAHILEQLLAKGHSVVTTVRTEDKAAKIREAYADKSAAGELQTVVVPDIARLDAFDDVVKIPGIEVVLHTASPFHFKISDPKKDLVDPAVIGTTGILKAIARSAPAVRRVVVTSSFAAILDEPKISNPATVFSEASWNPVTIDDIYRSSATAYRASKTLAERAAWAFVAAPPADSVAKFDLVTVNPPMVFGPVAHHLASLDGLNTSNERFLDLLRGKWKAGGVPSTGAAMIWVDVRDVAAAHVRAGLELPAAGGKRLFTTAGSYSNAAIVDIVRRNFPADAAILPSDDQLGPGKLPPADQRFKVDNAATTELLGIDWIPFEKTVVDTIKSLKEHGA